MRRLAQFVRLHLSRVCLASVCVCLASASVSRLRLRASASVCVCLASVSRLVSRLRLSRVCLRLSRVCLRRASCLESVSRLSRVCVCLRRASCLASVCVGRLVSRLSVLVNACGDWLILCVGRHSKSSKGFCYRHTIYPLAVHIDYMNRPLIF